MISFQLVRVSQLNECSIKSASIASLLISFLSFSVVSLTLFSKTAKLPARLVAVNRHPAASIYASEFHSTAACIEASQMVQQKLTTSMNIFPTALHLTYRSYPATLTCPEMDTIWYNRTQECDKIVNLI